MEAHLTVSLREIHDQATDPSEQIGQHGSDVGGHAPRLRRCATVSYAQVLLVRRARPTLVCTVRRGQSGCVIAVLVACRWLSLPLRCVSARFVAHVFFFKISHFFSFI